MKGGAWGEDILKYSTMVFAFLFGIGVAILGIWTIFNIFRAGWGAAGPDSWGVLMGNKNNSNDRRRGGNRNGNGRNGNRNGNGNGNGNGNRNGNAPVPAPNDPSPNDPNAVFETFASV